MITALAVETLLVSVLAWMSIQASVTLAAMTLAMLAMLWRGEAWKTVFLRTEAQLSQLVLQSRQLSPKIGFCDLVLWPRHVAVGYMPPYVEIVFRHESKPFDGHMRLPDLHPSDFREIRQTSHSISPVVPLRYSEACWASFRQQSDSNQSERPLR